MRNLRGAARKRRRFKVLLGTAASFTTDVSPGGFCTETMRVLPPKTVVKGHIEALGKKVPFAGRVAWTVPGDSTLNLRGRMGISFTEIGPELLEILNG
jgi:PilZ domain